MLIQLRHQHLVPRIFSEDLFLAKGIISVTFEADCQTCFKKSLIKLNLELNVGIKDIKYENLDKKGSLEVHYQDLGNFDINDLVSEEIYLNFPSIVTCCTTERSVNSEAKSLNKVRPFQKIRLHYLFNVGCKKLEWSLIFFNCVHYFFVLKEN